MLFCSAVSAAARVDASVAIAVVFEDTSAEMSESASWNAATISSSVSRVSGDAPKMSVTCD